MEKKSTDPTPAPDEKAAPKGAAAEGSPGDKGKPKAAKTAAAAPAPAADRKQIPENVSEAQWIDQGGQYVVAQRYFRHADQTWVEEGDKYAISTRERVQRMLSKGLIKRDPAMIKRLAPEGGKSAK